ncbi:MAG: hypothetical protein JNL63_11580 [Bacteroidia bacterium]|nr:hypothetical protein [Bacteroidia bacterium]
MLVRFFRSHQPVLLIIIPVIAALLWLPAFIHPALPAVKHQMPLFELMVKPLLSNPLLCSIAAFFLLIIQAFLFNYIIDKYEITGKRSYLPVLMYIVFTSFSPELLWLHPGLFANIFILLALNRVLATYRNTSALSPCFDAGFLIALASLFYFPAALMVIFVMIAVLVLLPFSWRLWVIVLLGFLLPYIYVHTWYFLFEGTEYLWIDRVLFPVIDRNTVFNGEMAQPYSELILFLGIAAVLSIGRGADAANRSVQHRSTMAVLRWLFVIGVLTLLITPTLSYIYFFAALLPLLVIITGYFLWARMVWVAEIIMWMLILTIAYNHFGISH